MKVPIILSLILLATPTAVHANHVKNAFCDLQALQAQMRSGNPAVAESARTNVAKNYGPNVAKYIALGGNVVQPNADCVALLAKNPSGLTAAPSRSKQTPGGAPR